MDLRVAVGIALGNTGSTCGVGSSRTGSVVVVLGLLYVRLLPRPLTDRRAGFASPLRPDSWGGCTSSTAGVSAAPSGTASRISATLPERLPPRLWRDRFATFLLASDCSTAAGSASLAWANGRDVSVVSSG